jgi:hypothetical protein
VAIERIVRPGGRPYRRGLRIVAYGSASDPFMVIPNEEILQLRLEQQYGLGSGSTLSQEVPLMAATLLPMSRATQLESETIASPARCAVCESGVKDAEANDSFGDAAAHWMPIRSATE